MGGLLNRSGQSTLTPVSLGQSLASDKCPYCISIWSTCEYLSAILSSLLGMSRHSDAFLSTAQSLSSILCVFMERERERETHGVLVVLVVSYLVILEDY